MTHATLQGRVALVTGAARGIGREIALKLAAEGATVFVNDLEAAPVQSVIAAIRKRGGSALGIAGDVTATQFPD